MQKEYKLVGRSGQVIKLSGKNIFGLWCDLHYKGYRLQR